MKMAFKAAFVAHAPDADPEKHRCVIETPRFKMFAVIVGDQEQAKRECKALIENEGIHSILLCPGFTHRDIAEIADTAGESVSVCVARGDGPSSRIAMEVMKKEGWFAPGNTE
jgi:hypothetical protein